MMIMSREGIIIRINVDDISQQGRYAHGVTLIRLGEGDAVIDMAKVIGGKDDPTGTDDETGEPLNQEELPLQ